MAKANILGEQMAQVETKEVLSLENKDETSDRDQTESAPKPSKSSSLLQNLKNVMPHNINEWKADYEKKGLDKIPDTFILYRIIGNDLYPRHKKGQMWENLQFVLLHEPELEACEKRWVVNRIIDKEEEQAIIALLVQHNKPFIHIPFREKEYKTIGWDMECLPEPGYLLGERNDGYPRQHQRLIAATYRHKNNYVMNNNGARNVALRDGKLCAKWVLPWDGNCFVTSTAWEQIRADVTASPYLKYFAVPMTRVVDNGQLLTDDFTPEPVEEPQLIFRMDSAEEFNEEFCYGRRSKVELLWRLGIPGKWDRWKIDPWDLERPALSSEACQFGVAGWVARMSSGMKILERDFDQRGLARLQAIINTLRYVDVMLSERSADPKGLLMLRTQVLEEERNDYLSGKPVPLIDRLIADAEEALTRGPYSVRDKKSLPPSGNPNDYWHPAPYWWPNPDTEDGLPYVNRDGVRVPGTRLYEPESDKFDRTRLQRVFDDSFILSLAWYFTGQARYAQHGTQILERFFVHPETRMSPHLLYAQVRMGRNKNEGNGSGIIEMKDMYYYLDAVRLLKSAGVAPAETISLFKEWLSNYLDWILHSDQGKKERKATNNHGTYYDLQIAAIADYLDDRSLLFETLVRAQSRIVQQFAQDGSQPEELKRTTTAHYCCFNLQGWINLSEIASRWGVDFWSYRASNGVGLIKAARWLLSFAGKEWPYQQSDAFDAERFMPIWFAIPQGSIDLPGSAAFTQSKYAVNPRFSPHYGVRPYWNLGLSQSGS